MRHNRYGDLAEDEPDIDRPHRCDRGWIDRNADHPRPCLLCKPHLARTTTTPDDPREDPR